MAIIQVTNKIEKYHSQSIIIAFIKVANYGGTGGSDWETTVTDASKSENDYGSPFFNGGLTQNASGNDYPWAATSYNLYLNSKFNYLGNLDITYHGNPNDKAGYISGATFNDHGMSKSYQWISEPSVDYVSGANFQVNGQLASA